MPAPILSLTEDDLVRSPAWYPLQTEDRGAVTMVHLDEAAYAAASFLDERILALPNDRRRCALHAVQAAAAQLAPSAHYVFHTGHVGSTLISRLIGAHPSLFSIREPALLRTMAGNAAIMDLASVLALLARTWRPDQRAVIKATSIVSELAQVILAGAHRPTAIFMFATPVNYLRSILAGPNSRAESKALAPSRLRRLVRRLDDAVWHSNPDSEGEQVAMNWLCEMTALHQAALRFPAQVLWVNFDAFLNVPLLGLDVIFRRLGAASSSREIEALANGPIMRQYSKAPEHAYDHALRREVLRSADWQHGLEIERGLNWLNAVAKDHPSASAVLETAASVRLTL